MNTGVFILKPIYHNDFGCLGRLIRNSEARYSRVTLHLCAFVRKIFHFLLLDWWWCAYLCVSQTHWMFWLCNMTINRESAHLRVSCSFPTFLLSSKIHISHHYDFYARYFREIIDFEPKPKPLRKHKSILTAFSIIYFIFLLINMKIEMNAQIEYFHISNAYSLVCCCCRLLHRPLVAFACRIHLCMKRCLIGSFVINHIDFHTTFITATAQRAPGHSIQKKII